MSLSHGVESKTTSNRRSLGTKCNLLELVGNPPLLPDELWIKVFELLDIVDLSNCSHVCTQFRHVALSKQLVVSRLHNTAKWLEKEYPQRPTSRELYERHVLLSSVPNIGIAHLKLSIKLQRTLRKDALRRGLERRPARQELIERGVIKPGGNLARRMSDLEKQQTVDVIRNFYGSTQRPSLETAIRRGIVPATDNSPRPVSLLTRMFSYNRERIPRRPLKEAPARANVNKLKKKFEQMAKEAAGSENRCSALQSQFTGITTGAVQSMRHKFITITC